MWTKRKCEGVGSAEKNKALINRAATIKFQKRIDSTCQGAKKVSPLQSQTERAGKKQSSARRL